MNRFLTLFPKAENVHLIKDVGMIPYTLSKNHKFTSGLASFENGNYPYLSKEVNGLKHIIIKNFFRNDFLNIVLFIIKNYKNWDVLQCYHITKESIAYLSLFKFLKIISFSKSITFLKFDSNDLAYTYKINFIVRLLLKNINILSVESKKLFNYYSKVFKLSNNLYLVPNGFKINENVICSEKKNIIITVGRIGSFEKNNEYLLEEFVNFSKTNLDWKLKLIGPIEPKFNLFIENFFINYPQLKTRIEFTGNINDRDTLNQYYKQAKIFVLTSPMEGFPLVYLEALSKGCFIISPRFSSAIDITDNGVYGDFFENNVKDNLSRKLIAVIENESKLINICKKAQVFANTHYTWEKICIELNMIIIKS